MRAALLLLLPLLAAPQEAPPPAPKPVPVQGTLAGRTTWSGTVLVGGDVEIPAGSALVIEAGTRVVIAGTDSSRSGWNPRTVEIRVAGDLLVSGTEERPVVIGPAGEPREAPPLPEGIEEEKVTPESLHQRYGWHGLVLLPVEGNSPLREIRGALLFGAWAGIQIPAGKARVEGCVLLDCGVGIEVGTAFLDGTRYGAPPGVARPEVSRTRFAGCRTAVSAMHQAAPRLDRCVVAHCRGGVGAHRGTGRFYPLQEPGATVTRCDLLGNGVGVIGPSLVTDSLFLRNRRALALSTFHVDHGSGVDEYRLRGNVFAGNGAVLAGESLAGEAAIVEDPGYGADAAALDAAVRAPWPPLPAALRLREDGAARGRATGGGDPGAAADPPPGGGIRPWTSGRRALLRPLAARLAAEKDEGRTLSRLKPSPGASLGESWWCRVEGDERGVLAPGALFGEAEGTGVLCWRVRSSAAGTARLEVNGDLAVLDGWWNGAALPEVRVPRRFDGEGAVVEVALKKGTNLLLLRVRGRGASPRLVAALEPPAGAILEQEGAPDPVEARIASAKVETDREGRRWWKVALAAPVSWASPAEARTPEGIAVPVSIESRQSLRVGPLPDSLEDPATLHLTGLRSP